jgi:fimbrial chaperone protein
MKWRQFWCAVLLSTAFACARASTFNISPIRAELGGPRHTAALTLTNADETPVVVQVSVLQWSQSDGADQLDDTREMLATPPVLQIPGTSEQIIRVALRREPEAARELAYRVIFQEVPLAAAADFTGLRVALRLSIPIFVAPANGKASADVAWEARWLPDGDLEVAATNHGNGHMQVIDFDLELAGADLPLHGNTTKYILPGSRMVWTLKAPADATKPKPIKVHGRSDQGEFAADVATPGL